MLRTLGESTLAMIREKSRNYMPLIYAETPRCLRAAARRALRLARDG